MPRRQPPSLPLEPAQAEATSAPPSARALLHTAHVQVGRGGAPSAKARLARFHRRSQLPGASTNVGEPGTGSASWFPAPSDACSPRRSVRVRGRGRPPSFRPKWAAQTFVPTLGQKISRTRVLHKGEDLSRCLPPDRRFVYKDTDYPWRCVGRVVSGSKIGSGVLIGPRHVLASHVMNWSNLSVSFTAEPVRQHESGLELRHEGLALRQDHERQHGQRRAGLRRPCSLLRSATRWAGWAPGSTTTTGTVSRSGRASATPPTWAAWIVRCSRTRSSSRRRTAAT